jgi:glycosyltransferase involved in cell wall biosynthesis
LHPSYKWDLPRVSFVIPTLNSEQSLNKCLTSIINQEYPDFEIIIVDGLSRDKTIEIAKRYTNKIYFDSRNYGSACQIGIENSTGKILALFDSDIIIPHKNWLKNAVKPFDYSDKISTVWPVNVAPPNGSLTARLYFNMWKTFMEDRIKRGKSFFGGGNSLILRNCIENIGGVDKNIHWGADYDWAKKLKNCGYRVVLIRDPLYHDTMKTIKEFAKKQFLGAATFTKEGFQLMGLSFGHVLYEHIILGTKGMMNGLFKHKDISWLLYPLFVCIRLFAYGAVYLTNLANKVRTREDEVL